jgi:hypothetical protein
VGFSEFVWLFRPRVARTRGRSCRPRRHRVGLPYYEVIISELRITPVSLHKSRPYANLLIETWGLVRAVAKPRTNCIPSKQLALPASVMNFDYTCLTKTRNSGI